MRIGSNMQRVGRLKVPTRPKIRRIDSLLEVGPGERKGAGDRLAENSFGRNGKVGTEMGKPSEK